MYHIWSSNNYAPYCMVPIRQSVQIIRKEATHFQKIYAKAFQTPLQGTIQAQMKCFNIRFLLGI